MLATILFAPALLNAAAGEAAPVPWPVSTYGIIFGAPAIGPTGEIVFAVRGGQETVNSQTVYTPGTVYSYNPDGTLRWAYVDSTDWIDSSPTIGADGTVYFGGWDTYLYAVHGDTGALKWKFETGNIILSSPAIGPDGTLYFGSNDGIFYAVYPNGAKRWSYDALYDPISGSAILNASGDTVYFGTENGILYALNAATGAKRWSYSIPQLATERAILSAPSLGADGSVYFGSETGRIYALSAGGTLNWMFPPAATTPTEGIKSSPVIDSTGTVYFASQDGYLYAVDTLGFQLWETFVGDVFYSTPAIDAQGNIIVAGYAGSITVGAATSFACVDALGNIKWEYLVSGYNDSSPNIAPDGSVYIGAHDGKLYKLQGYTGLKSSGWPRSQGNRRQSGWGQDLKAAELVDYFPAITKAQSRWALVPWFGAGWLTAAGLPWIQHIDHGYLYVIQAGGGAFLYDPLLQGWLYANSSAPSFYFFYNTGTWLYHAVGTSVSTGRWFYDYNRAVWLTEAQIQ